MNRKPSISKYFSTSVFRLVAIVIIAIVPLNVLLLAFSRITINEVETQISIEMENALELYMTQMDGAMERIVSKLRVVSFDNVDFIRLNNKEITDQTEYYQQLQAAVRLTNDYYDILTDHELINGVFTVFPDKGINVMQNIRAPYGRYVIQYVTDVIQNPDGEDSLQGWNSAEIDGHSVVIYLGRYKNAYYGAWIDLSSFMAKIGMETGENAVSALVDADGNVVYFDNTEFDQEEIKNLYQHPNNGKYILLQATSDYADISFVQLIERSEMMQQLPSIVTILQVLSVGMLVAIPIIIIGMKKWMIAPLEHLSEAMDKIEHGNMDFRIQEVHSGSEFEQINRHFNQMMDEVEELNHRVLEEQLKKKDIQMRFLSQQIQPHFILNAMNIIYSYEPEEYSLIQKMILCLSRYFRYVVNANKDFVELAQEMEHITNYLDIQHERYPDVFFSKVEYEEEIADCLVPPLLIQSFAENAIKHSLNIDNKIDIYIIGRRTEDGRIKISLWDTGEGIGDDVLKKIETFRETREYQDGLGIGIQNAIERLELNYEGNASIDIYRIEPHGTAADIVLPLMRKGDDKDEGHTGR